MSATLAPESGITNGKGGGTSSALLNHVHNFDAHYIELDKLKDERRRLIDKVRSVSRDIAGIESHLLLAGGLQEAAKDG